MFYPVCIFETSSRVCRLMRIDIDPQKDVLRSCSIAGRATAEWLESREVIT